MVYTDPIHDEESVGKLMGASEPAGADLEFRVKTIEKLQWLYKQSAPYGVFLDHHLSGHTPDRQPAFEDDGSVSATFRGSQFHILFGHGLVGSGIYDVDELDTNEGYEEFLLSLAWWATAGWLTDMHALGLAADEDIELLPEKAK